mmetsp:Transcript_770/g.1060  ORF Transcript_770/g.1060 Transcript_770/m.1060 type:complete len:931 (-) Transcript_770:111-2903(-)
MASRFRVSNFRAGQAKSGIERKRTSTSRIPASQKIGGNNRSMMTSKISNSPRLHVANVKDLTGRRTTRSPLGVTITSTPITAKRTRDPLQIERRQASRIPASRKVVNRSTSTSLRISDVTASSRLPARRVSSQKVERTPPRLGTKKTPLSYRSTPFPTTGISSRRRNHLAQKNQTMESGLTSMASSKIMRVSAGTVRRPATRFSTGDRKGHSPQESRYRIKTTSSLKVATRLASIARRPKSALTPTKSIQHANFETFSERTSRRPASSQCRTRMTPTQMAKLRKPQHSVGSISMKQNNEDYATKVSVQARMKTTKKRQSLKATRIRRMQTPKKNVITKGEKNLRQRRQMTLPRKKATKDLSKVSSTLRKARNSLPTIKDSRNNAAASHRRSGVKRETNTRKISKTVRKPVVPTARSRITSESRKQSKPPHTRANNSMLPVYPKRERKLIKKINVGVPKKHSMPLLRSNSKRQISTSPKEPSKLSTFLSSKVDLKKESKPQIKNRSLGIYGSTISPTPRSTVKIQNKKPSKFSSFKSSKVSQRTVPVKESKPTVRDRSRTWTIGKKKSNHIEMLQKQMVSTSGASPQSAGSSNGYQGKKWGTVDTTVNTRRATVGGIVIREEKSTIFGKEEQTTAEGKTLKEKMAMFKKNMEKINEVNTDKVLFRQEETLRRARKLSKEQMAQRTKMVQKIVGNRLQKQKALEIAEEGLFGEVEEDEVNGEQVEGSPEEVKRNNKGHHRTLSVNKNNNAQIIARLSDKKKEAVYENLVKACRKAKVFSATNNLLDDKFIEMLVEGALKPGDILEELNLESNKIGNRGLTLLAEAIPHLQNLRTLKLRNQANKASVPVQKILLDAIDSNEVITKIGVDVTNDENRRRQIDIERRHMEIRRQRRKAALNADDQVLNTLERKPKMGGERRKRKKKKFDPNMKTF